MSATWIFSPLVPLKESSSIDIYPGYGESLRIRMLREFAAEYRRHHAADVRYSMILEGFYNDIGEWSQQRVSRRCDTLYEDLVTTIGLDRGSIYRTMTTSPNLAGIVRVRFTRNRSPMFLSESGHGAPKSATMGPSRNAADPSEPEGAITMDAAEGSISTEVEVAPLGAKAVKPIKLSLTVTVGANGLEAVESSLKLFKKQLREKAVLWGTVQNIALSIKLSSEIKFNSEETGRVELEKFKTKLKAGISADVGIGVVRFPIEATVYVDHAGGTGWGISATIITFH